MWVYSLGQRWLFLWNYFLLIIGRLQWSRFLPDSKKKKGNSHIEKILRKVQFLYTQVPSPLSVPQPDQPMGRARAKEWAQFRDAKDARPECAPRSAPDSRASSSFLQASPPAIRVSLGRAWVN